MSDTGSAPPHGGPPPGPAGRPLPPAPPPPPHATWWIALVAIGTVVVAIAAVIGIAVLARGGHDASSAPPRSAPPATTLGTVPVVTATAPATPAAGRAVTDPQGAYAITLGPDWSDISAQMAAGTEAWAVAGGADGVTPNVNVVTQELPGVDVPALLTGTIADIERVGGAVLASARVTAPDRTELGRIAYTAITPASSIELSFLAVFTVRDGIAAVATLTAPVGRFDALAADVEPYLLTLRVTP